MSTDEQRKRRGSSVIWPAALFVVVVAVFALIVGGFLRGAGHTEDDEGCGCPRSETAAASIDWAGTGDTPMLDATAAEADGSVILLRYGSDTDPGAAFRSLATRLDEAYGSDLETQGVGPNRVGELEDSGGQWRLVFQTDRFSGDDFPVTLHVTLTVRVPDEQAEDALEELAAAVGRLPS